MAKRPRRQPEPGEFQDPLSNYDQPRYDDGLERSLCQDKIAKVIKIEPYERVDSTMTVRDVITDLVEKDIAAVVVTKDDRPVGILTERDVQDRIANRLDELANKTVAEVMTKDPIVVFDTDSPARAMNLMTSRNVRHIPVVDADGRLIGVIGPSRLTSYLKQYFSDVASA
jgi:CBS domain-containing protein